MHICVGDININDEFNLPGPANYSDAVSLPGRMLIMKNKIKKSKFLSVVWSVWQTFDRVDVASPLASLRRRQDRNSD